MDSMRSSSYKASIGGGVAAHLTALELPRIETPQFENDATGNLKWDKFK